jgi:enamine deaminase RidA (YjgF/YER057c/UK114 family)
MTDVEIHAGGDHPDDRLRLVEPAWFPWLDHHRYAFSLGVRRGPEVWLSGQTASAFDPAEGTVTSGGDMTHQATVAWDKVLAVLSGAGLGPSHVTRVVEYVTAEGLARYPLAVGVREARLGGYQPAVATVPVEHLVRPDAWLEVEVSAHDQPDAFALVHLPTLTGQGATLAEQLESIFRKAAELLEPYGLGLSDVVKTVDYTTPATRREYRASGAVRRAYLGPDFPTATGVLVGQLQVPSALISLDLVASRKPKMVIDPGWAAGAGLTFSPAVRAGHHVFLSGTTAFDFRTRSVHSPGDIAGQALFVYEQLDELIRLAGGHGLADLVKTIEYVAPAATERYRDVGPVRQQVLGRPLPAATGVLVGSLLQPDWLIEVDALAVIDVAD